MECIAYIRLDVKCPYCHDNIIIWKRFQHCLPFVGELTGHRWFLFKRVIKTELLHKHSIYLWFDTPRRSLLCWWNTQWIFVLHGRDTQPLNYRKQISFISHRFYLHAQLNQHLSGFSFEFMSNWYRIIKSSDCNSCKVWLFADFPSRFPFLNWDVVTWPWW